MPTELSIHAVHQDGLRMTATNGEHSVLTDYPLEPGQAAAGFKPMELLLASLAACAGSVVASLLRKSRQPVTGVEVDVRGQRRDGHPTIFTSIAMEFVVRGTGIDEAIVQQVVERAERICPVWAMLSPTTPVATTVRITGAEQGSTLEV